MAGCSPRAWHFVGADLWSSAGPCERIIIIHVRHSSTPRARFLGPAGPLPSAFLSQLFLLSPLVFLLYLQCFVPSILPKSLQRRKSR